MKKLAVIMPTFNCAQFLNYSIDSMLSQTYSDFDLYIYDDCSTDNTKEIIEKYNDKRIFYTKNIENLGISKTLNLGLECLLSKYEYIVRMDADDWCFPERFKKQIAFMDDNPDLIMSGTQGYWLNDLSKIPLVQWEYPTKFEILKLYLLFTASFGHSSIILRTNFFEKNKLRYNQFIKTCEDWDLWIRVSQLGRVANLPDFLMKYRIVPTSNHRFVENEKLHLKERSIIISNYWKTFNINLSSEQVFEYYYEKNPIIDEGFLLKLKVLVDSFNYLFFNHTRDLNYNEKKRLSYLLLRRLVNYWKRLNENRFDPNVLLILIIRVKFISRLKIIMSLFK